MKEDTNDAAIELTSSMQSSSSCEIPKSPPDGGAKAWTMVLIGHLVVFNTWGYILCYGVFQTYYSSTLGRSLPDISWIGSVQIFLLFLIGTFSGRALDSGIFRPVLAVGATLSLFGMFMNSICTKYWQIFLAQGLCTGIGNGLQFSPTMALVSTYFSSNRSLALGVVASGSATGGMVYPIIVRQLLPRVGFGWTVRVLGFVTLGTTSLILLFLKPRLPPRKAGPLVEWVAFRDITYSLCCLAMFFNFWAVYFAFYYIGTYARSIIHTSYEDSITMLLIMNGVGAVGRIFPNYLADRKFGALNTITFFAFSTGILMFSWAGVSSYEGLWIYAVVYGFSSSALQSLFPAMLSSLTPDPGQAGVRMGMGFSVVSVATLTGPPLAGALVKAGHGSYLAAQIWGGTVLMLGGVIFTIARLARTGTKLRVKI